MLPAKSHFVAFSFSSCTYNNYTCYHMSHCTKGFQTHPFFQSSQYLCELRILCSFLKAVCGCSLAKSCLTICEPMDCSVPGSSVRGISQARIQEWVGCHFFLQGIFPTQGLNSHLLHWQADSLTLNHLGSLSKAEGTETDISGQSD